MNKTEKRHEVYLDNAATTPVDKEVMGCMEPYFCREYGNPGSFNTIGLRARHAVDDARMRIAKVLGCKASEIIFTGSGTESDNLALKGAARALKGRGNHIITTKIEHDAVLSTCRALEKEGFDITYADVNEHGLVDPEHIKKAITTNTILISIIYASNEIGTIQPIREIASIAKEKGIRLHTDACQAAGYLNINVDDLGIDLMTINASKIYGPKGIGLLYARTGTILQPMIHGGGHEHGLRSGTENVPCIIGFAKALEKAQEIREEESKRATVLRDELIEGLSSIEGTSLNGHPKRRLPNNVNMSFKGIEGEAILLHLDDNGIYASSGSACSSRKLEPSHVLKAIGLPHNIAHGSIRLTLGKHTTEEDIRYVLEVFPGIVEKLRAMSPIK